jgi:hypothetical protein
MNNFVFLKATIIANSGPQSLAPTLIQTYNSSSYTTGIDGFFGV